MDTLFMAALLYKMKTFISLPYLGTSGFPFVVKIQFCGFDQSFAAQHKFN